MPLVLMAGPDLDLVIVWCSLLAALAADGFHCLTNNGLWLAALMLVGNATCVASGRAYM
jgi:hypothetical protein